MAGSSMHTVILHLVRYALSCDDDGTFTRHAKRNAREFSYRRVDLRSSISSWHRCMWILDFMMSTRLGVIVAITDDIFR